MRERKRERERRGDSRTTRSVSTGRYWVKVFFPPPRRHRRPSRSLARSSVRSLVHRAASSLTNSTRWPSLIEDVATARSARREEGRYVARRIGDILFAATARVARSSTRFNRRRTLSSSLSSSLLSLSSTDRVVLSMHNAIHGEPRSGTF